MQAVAKPITTAAAGIIAAAAAAQAPIVGGPVPLSAAKKQLPPGPPKIGVDLIFAGSVKKVPPMKPNAKPTGTVPIPGGELPSATPTGGFHLTPAEKLAQMRQNNCLKVAIIGLLRKPNKVGPSIHYFLFECDLTHPKLLRFINTRKVKASSG